MTPARRAYFLEHYGYVPGELYPDRDDDGPASPIWELHGPLPNLEGATWDDPEGFDGDGDPIEPSAVNYDLPELPENDALTRSELLALRDQA